MNSSRVISLAKWISLLGFVVLLSTTYLLRGEALTLSRIGFSAEKEKAELDERRAEETYPDRVARHAVAVKNYDLQLQHHQTMLELYTTNYEEYSRRIQQQYIPPQLPQQPEPPPPPEFEKRMTEIRTEFRLQKFRYFWITSSFNWVAWLAALALAGGLVFLLLFDLNGSRLFYVVVLIISFVFMIGPSFHTMMSLMVGGLQPQYFDSP